MPNLIIDFSNGKLLDSIKTSSQPLNDLGRIPQRVADYLQRKEVDPSLVTDDVVALEKRMWQFVQSRGATLKDDGEKYDEILFAAYDDALRSRGGRGDPLDNLQSAHVDPEFANWDFRVDLFEADQDRIFLPQSVLMAGALDYVFELGDRLGIFSLAEALVLDWANGRIDVAEGPAAGKLYRYWKLLDRRSTPEERGVLFRRVLNKGTAQVLSGGVVNEPFPNLWGQLMAEIADYIDKSERVDSGRSETSPISSKPIQQAIREIQYNLTEYATGMAFMQTRELYAQLQQAFDILRDPDVVASFGGVRRRSMWTVIEEIARRRSDRSFSVAPLVRVAVEGNKIYQQIADFDETTFTPDQLDQLLASGEAYIINASISAKTLGDGMPSEEADAGDMEEGEFDEEGEDF